eukprot:4853017-Amphidinium_carterae.1
MALVSPHSTSACFFKHNPTAVHQVLRLVSSLLRNSGSMKYHPEKKFIAALMPAASCAVILQRQFNSYFELPSKAKHGFLANDIPRHRWRHAGSWLVFLGALSIWLVGTRGTVSNPNKNI